MNAIFLVMLMRVSCHMASDICVAFVYPRVRFGE